MKKLKYVFAALAAVLSHTMCAAVAYHYRGLLCGMEHAGFSGPASLALWLVVPFGAGIAVCVALAIYFGKK